MLVYASPVARLIRRAHFFSLASAKTYTGTRDAVKVDFSTSEPYFGAPLLYFPPFPRE
jgi:hypothetical protein